MVHLVTQSNINIILRVAIVALFVFSLPELLAVPAKTVSATQPVINACTVDWPPFTIANGNSITGIDTEIVQEAAKRMGYQLNISIIPWKRCLQLARDTDQIDIVYSASKSPDREKFLRYTSKPLHTLNFVFAVKGNSPNGWTGTNYSVLPQPIGIPLGYSVTKKLKDIPGVTLDENSNNDLQNIQKFKNNRVKTIVMERTVLAHLTKTQDVKVTTLDPPVDGGKEYFITVSNKSKHPELLPKLELEIEKMRSDGTIDAIEKKYK